MFAPRASRPVGSVVGIDVTREMLDRARERPARSGGAVHYVQADAARPPIREADPFRRRSSPLFEDPAAAVDAWWTASALAAASPCELPAEPQRPRRTADLAFEGFVRLSAPGTRLSGRSHASAFERRVRAARERLAERTVARRYETMAGGFVAASGTVRYGSGASGCYGQYRSACSDDSALDLRGDHTELAVRIVEPTVSSSQNTSPVSR